MIRLLNALAVSIPLLLYFATVEATPAAGFSCFACGLAIATYIMDGAAD